MEIVKYEEFKKLDEDQKMAEITRLREEYTCVQISKEWDKSVHYVYSFNKKIKFAETTDTIDKDFKKIILSEKAYSVIKSKFLGIIDEIINEVAKNT